MRRHGVRRAEHGVISVAAQAAEAVAVTVVRGVFASTPPHTPSASASFVASLEQESMSPHTSSASTSLLASNGHESTSPRASSESLSPAVSKVHESTLPHNSSESNIERARAHVGAHLAGVRVVRSVERAEHGVISDAAQAAEAVAVAVVRGVFASTPPHTPSAIAAQYIAVSVVVRVVRARVPLTAHDVTICVVLGDCHSRVHIGAQRVVVGSTAASRSHESTYAAVRSSTQQYAAVRSSTQQYAAVRSSTQQYAAVRSSTQQYDAVRRSTQQYAAVRSSTQ